MVEIRTVDESDLSNFRDFHNMYVDRDEPLETLRERFDEWPELFVGAFDTGELIGHCLGRPRSGHRLELEGIAVKEAHQREGIGKSLLTGFEERAEKLGFQRIELGSAGGYVDTFYAEQGYAPDSALVRLDSPEARPADREIGFEIADERIEDGTRKLYVEVDGIGAPPIEVVRSAFDDPEAIYIMSKDLDTG